MVSAGRSGWLPPELLGGAEVVYDLHRDGGPLAGLEAALAASRHDGLFVVACDMPAVDAAVAGRLLRASAGHDAAVPLIAGRPQPMCAAYRRGAAAAVGAALGTGRLQARGLLDDLDVAFVTDLDPDLFVNLNTPEDFIRFFAATR